MKDHALQRLGAEARKVLHQGLFLSFVARSFWRLDETTGLQSDLIAEDAQVRRRIA